MRKKRYTHLFIMNVDRWMSRVKKNVRTTMNGEEEGEDEM